MSLLLILSVVVTSFISAQDTLIVKTIDSKTFVCSKEILSNSFSSSFLQQYDISSFEWFLHIHSKNWEQLYLLMEFYFKVSLDEEYAEKQLCMFAKKYSSKRLVELIQDAYRLDSRIAIVQSLIDALLFKLFKLSKSQVYLSYARLNLISSLMRQLPLELMNSLLGIEELTLPEGLVSNKLIAEQFIDWSLEQKIVYTMLLVSAGKERKLRIGLDQFFDRVVESLLLTPAQQRYLIDE